MPRADFEKGTKVCSGKSHDGVPTELPISDFSRSHRTADGKRSQCRKCVNMSGKDKVSVARRKRVRKQIDGLGKAADIGGASVEDYLAHMRSACGGLKRLATLHWDQIMQMKDGSAVKVQAIQNLLKTMIASEKMKAPADVSSMTNDEVDRRLVKIMRQMAEKRITEQAIEVETRQITDD